MPEAIYLEPCRPGCALPATFLHLTQASEGTSIALRCAEHRLPTGSGLETHHAPTGFLSAVPHVPGQSGLFDHQAPTGSR